MDATAQHLPGSWSYILVTGDGVIARRLPQVAELLVDAGLTPTIAQVVPWGAETMDRVFGCGDEGGVTHPGGEDLEFSLDLHDRLYRHAPAVVVLAVDPDGHAPERVLRCKGATWPEASAPGTVRHLGENVVFNVAHCPDDEASAIDELTKLLGPEPTRRLIARGSAAGSPILAVTGVSAAEAALPELSGPQAISYAAIANRLRRRIIQRLVLERDGDGTWPRLLDAHRALDEELDALAGCDTSTEQRVVAQARSEAITRDLAAAAASGPGTIQEAVRMLHELLVLDGERDLEPVLALRRHDVYISGLEQVMIESHSHGFRPNDHTRGRYASKDALTSG